MAETTAGGDFADLLARAVKGDGAAQLELVRIYEPKVRMVARVLLGPALRPYLESSDLTQSVHKSIVHGLSENKFEIAGPDQLIGLALYGPKTQGRSSLAASPTPTAAQRAQVAEQHRQDANVLASLSSGGLDPAANAQFRDHLDNLCDHLDETEKRVIDLRLEGYTLAEIADLIGVSRVALRVRMTRLRQRLEAAGVLTDWF